MEEQGKALSGYVKDIYLCTGVCIYVCSYILILFDIPLDGVIVMLVDIDHSSNFLCNYTLHPFSFTTYFSPNLGQPLSKSIFSTSTQVE